MQYLGMASNGYVYRGRLISVRVLRTPRGEREVVEHPGAVAILVRDERGQVLLVRQFRDAIGEDLWEIPAGKLKSGERPLAAAKRELQEETGLSAARWTYLGTIFPTPGYSAERIFLFLAQGITGEARASSEIAQVGFFPLADVVALSRQGKGDGKTLAALSFLPPETGPPSALT
jgi:ADP-ribose pyrophosphatase